MRSHICRCSGVSIPRGADVQDVRVDDSAGGWRAGLNRRDDTATRGSRFERRIAGRVLEVRPTTRKQRSILFRRSHHSRADRGAIEPLTAFSTPSDPNGVHRSLIGPKPDGYHRSRSAITLHCALPDFSAFSGYLDSAHSEAYST